VCSDAALLGVGADGRGDRETALAQSTMSVLPALLLAQAMTLSVEDRVELRARSFEGEERVDAEMRPGATLVASEGTTSYSVAYLPRLTALSLGAPDFETTLYHVVTASSMFRTRRTAVTLSQSLEYGTRNFRLSLAPAESGGEPDPGGSPVPEPLEAPPNQARVVDETLEFGSTTTTLEVAHARSRRIAELASLGYTASGGLDPSSREAYPLQRSPWLRLGLGVRATRRDTLWTALDGRVVLTDDDRRAELVTAEERWSRRLDKYFATDLFGGASFTRQTTGDAEPVAEVYPLAGAALLYDAGRLHASASASLTAAVDRTTGAVDQRALWSVQVSRSLGRATFGVGGSGARSLDMSREGALLSFTANAGAAYKFSSYVSGDLGATTSQVSYAGQDTSPILWTGYVGVTVFSGPMAF
jgi:hypothetical protein